MLIKITIRNFKCFNEVVVDLASPVVFIGPNNSGKTTALQALALWEVGLKKWREKRESNGEDQVKKNPEKRPGVTVNRRDLVAVPVPNAKLLWNGLHVRDTRRFDNKQETKNIRIDIIVEGFAANKKPWRCGFEFDYANEESFYCRPLRLSDDKNPERMPVPREAGGIDIAFLPPMSGLAANEIRLDSGAVNVRIGEGRTAEVLRNLCYHIFQDKKECWKKLNEKVFIFFGVHIEDPQYIQDRGEIVMSYKESGTILDISSSGRGLQQTLLLLSYMYANPGAVLLLDEPDAHLEILRQRQTYRFLTEAARENGNQIIAASHSEVLLNEAADRDTVVAFVGKPHRIGDRGSQVMKALREIGFEQYYQAEQTGWVLYLEGSTDLSILQTFAEILQLKDAVKELARPFVCYIGNQPIKAQEHFYGLREAVSHLSSIAIFDRLDRKPPGDPNFAILEWNKREIENYFCLPETLIFYAESEGKSEFGPLFSKKEAEHRVQVMEKCINDVRGAMEVLGKGNPWSRDTKVSDDFLMPLFKKYYEELSLPNTMTKKNFHHLARFVPKNKIDLEVKEKLDAITKVAQCARLKR